MKSRTLAAVFAFSLCAFGLEIVLPETTTTFEQTAAEELVLHLKVVYGDIAQIAEKDAKDGIAIYVGNTSLARANGVDCEKMDHEEWLLKSLDDKRLIAVGGSPRGVIYSAYELLERLYCVMWLDEHFTVMPKTALDKWPRINVAGKPSFRIRDIHTYYSDETGVRWLCEARNRNNYFHDEEMKDAFKEMQKYGLFKVYGRPETACHTYFLYTKDLPDEYEDCFSMDSQGKRVRPTSFSGPGQICLSNPWLLWRKCRPDHEGTTLLHD